MFQFKSCILILMTFVAIHQADITIGPGLWSVKSISKLEQNEEHTLNFDIVKRKLNRTHDAYNASCNFEEDFDYTLALVVDICKHVDGGCKPYQVISDQSLARFIEKYAKKNLEQFLANAGIDPPEFPIKAGKHEVTNFVIDYCSLPPKSPYGAYDAIVQILKGLNCVGMLKATLEFKKDDDNICGYADES